MTFSVFLVICFTFIENLISMNNFNYFQVDEKETKSLPQIRTVQPPPTYGYEEPKIVPEGKCTLRQALEFITDHQNDPAANKIDSIAKAHNMKVSDVENIVKNFRVFELYIPRDKNVDLTKSVLKALGANKIRQPLFAEPFQNVESKAEATAEEKK